MIRKLLLWKILQIHNVVLLKTKQIKKTNPHKIIYF